MTSTFYSQIACVSFNNDAGEGHKNILIKVSSWISAYSLTSCYAVQ